MYKMQHNHVRHKHHINVDTSFFVFGASYTPTRLHGAITPEDQNMNIHSRENLQFMYEYF
jgi:hypothetical protein